jgi:hypothetical protein
MEMETNVGSSICDRRVFGSKKGKYAQDLFIYQARFSIRLGKETQKTGKSSTPWRKNVSDSFSGGVKKKW